MRLNYGTDIALIDPETMRVFFDDGEPYTFEVSLQYIKCIPEEAAANTVALFNSTYPGLQQIIRLYVDGSNRAFPVGYRYLSNYKILELTFRHRTHWNKNNLKELLSLFEDEFRANGFRKEICGTLHALRDKCVHPKNIHGASEVIGFTSLDLDKIVEIEKFLPVLRKACAEVINRRSNGAFHVTPTEIGS